MFISLPKEFLLNKENSLINYTFSDKLDKRNFNEFTKIFFEKFNFLFLKSLNILKKFSLKELYENSSFIFSGVFYSHEIILLSLKPDKYNKETINLCKILLDNIELKDKSSTKKYKTTLKHPKSKKNKKKKERIKHATPNLSENLKKSIEQIKFEYKSLLVDLLDECKIQDTRAINSFYNNFIEEVIIPNVNYLCDFMNLETNTFEETFKTFIEKE